jgi:hypothetical protein
MSVAFRVDYEESLEKIIKYIEDEDDSPIESDDSYTNREILSASVVNDKSFNVGGNFSQKDLIEANGQVYIVVLQINHYDSYKREDNYQVEFLEAFLKKENAQKMIDTIRIHNEYYDLMKYGNKQDLDEKQRELENKFADLGFNRNLMKAKKNKDSNYVYYFDEGGEIKKTFTCWQGWGSSLNTCEIYETIALDYDKKFVDEAKPKRGRPSKKI